MDKGTGDVRLEERFAAAWGDVPLWARPWLWVWLRRWRRSPRRVFWVMDVKNGGWWVVS